MREVGVDLPVGPSYLKRAVEKQLTAMQRAELPQEALRPVQESHGGRHKEFAVDLKC